MGYRSIRNAALRRSRFATVADKKREDEALREIFAGVWNLNVEQDVSRPTAYLEHYKQVRTFGNAKSSHLRSASRKEIIEFLAVIKSYHGQSIRVVKDQLRASPPAAIAQHNNDATITKAIEISIRLWLMVEPPSITDDTLTIKEIVAQSFKEPRVPAGAKLIEELSHDFSARSLLRKGGIDVVWTSCLCDHLLMDGERQLKVFHYASLLRKYRDANSIERNLYPEDLLRETEETLELLFPTAGHGGKGSKRTRKLRDKDDVDIEAQLDLAVYRNLNHYTIWRERLKIVQYLYDRSKPGRPKQWWFDRRNKMEWATFWVAVVVFLLTLLFGIISSVTGILQVVASFRALH